MGAVLMLRTTNEGNDIRAEHPKMLVAGANEQLTILVSAAQASHSAKKGHPFLFCHAGLHSPVTQLLAKTTVPDCRAIWRSQHGAGADY